MAVRAAHLVRQVLADLGLAGALKTSGAKGLHMFVPIDDRDRRPRTPPPPPGPSRREPQALDPNIATTAFMKDDRGGKVFVDSTRVGGATVVAAYSPRIRPGVPVSFPVKWDDLDDIEPGDFTLHTALAQLGDADPWAAQMPDPQPLSPELIEEGHALPVGRVQAMHEGKRRARTRKTWNAPAPNRAFSGRRRATRPVPTTRAGREAARACSRAGRRPPSRRGPGRRVG